MTFRLLWSRNREPKDDSQEWLWMMQAIIGAAWERELGPGSLRIAVDQNLALYDAWERADTELTVSYEMAVRGLGITLEVEPVLTADLEWALSARVILLRSL